MSGRYEGLCLIYHIPNEAKRKPQTAAMLKATGMKSGVPDLCLPVPRGKYHGLYIEMKARKGKLSDSQKVWLSNLEEQGYKTAVCYGCDEAIKAIEEYYNEQ